MAFQVSPGVVTKEVDLSSIIPAVSTTIAGYAAHFEWGPADHLVTVDSENNLTALFGAPTDDNYKEWFPAANFLGYGSNLRVARYVGGTARNAAGPGGVSGDTSLIRNEGSLEAVLSAYNAAGASGHFHARYPGNRGNSLKVVMHDGGNANGYSAGNYLAWQYASQFGTNMPFTTGWAEAASGVDVNDGVNIAVIDQDGLFSGVKGTVLEVFEGVSKAGNAKNSDGTNNSYRDVINTSSRYVYATCHPEAGTNNAGVSGAASNIKWGSNLGGQGGTGVSFDFIKAASGNTSGYEVGLSGGTGEWSGATIPATGVSQGFGLLSDTDSEDISIIIGGPSNATVAGGIVDIADARKDCVAFLSPEEEDCIANNVPLTQAASETAVLEFRNIQLNKSSSYAFLDSGWKYQYDRFSDVYRWVPLNGDVAGIAVRSDENSETWFSPAGFNRGQVRGVVKLAFNPSKTNRDNLYKDQINPVVSFPGEGTVLFGDKTLLAKPSSFDRLNVRRLFIVLEKAIATAAKYQLFEQNDTFTRSHFKTMVEPFLRDVKARRGITEFKVVCDSSNNTSAVIDRNEFVADIFIKPTKSINFITLSFVATSQGVDFSEIGS
jgi:hypothetical protein